MEPARRGLSKSKLLSWLQCPKRLWLEVHKPETVTSSADREHLFAIGHSVGEAAQRLLPGGVLIGSQENLTTALAQTRQHIEAGTRVLFEPTFQRDGLLVRVDILRRGQKGYELREVKASGSVQEYHLPDAAIQAWVVRESGIPVESVQLQHVDTSFVYPGRGDYAGLFKSEGVDDEIRPLVKDVAKWLQGAQQTLAREEPERKIGSHCSKPFECGHLAYCGAHEARETEYPIAVLPYSGKLATRLAEEGYRDIRDIPEGRLENRLQERVRRVTANNAAELSAEAASVLRKLPYPRYYFDFETIGFAVPIWPGTKPYQQVPFQWSCHIEHSDGILQHASFLHLSADAPIEGVVLSMLSALGHEGPILAYNAAFETRCIEDLARMLPHHARELAAINERFIDLLALTRESYYHPDMKGSWSLKAVLPTIAPELNYENLEGVRDGSDAQAAYLEAISENVSPERLVTLRASLETYCERDTLALVRLTQFLEEGRGART